MALHRAWFSGKKGSMAGVEQAKLWALREVLSSQGQSTTQWQWMSEQVSVVGGGHPTREAVRPAPAPAPAPLAPPRILAALMGRPWTPVE